MTYGQIQAYTAAYEYDQNERLVLTMNAMAVAFAGTAKDRKKMAAALLGTSDTDSFDPEELERIMSGDFLADQATESKADILEWAAANFNANDPAFKPK